VAGDTVEAEAIKLTARTHQSLIWERTRHLLRLRSTLREYFPVALQAFPDLDAPDALELLGRAPDPDRATGLSIAAITAALRRAHRRNLEDRARQLRSLLRAQELRQAPVPQDAYATVVGSEGRGHRRAEHPDRPARGGGGRVLAGLGVTVAARVVAELAENPGRENRAEPGQLA
jgi:hypothetical protein